VKDLNIEDSKMKPAHIVIHHSLTNDSQSVSWEAIRKHHLQQGWRDIGYHYGIELVGNHYELFIGRQPDQIGAHCKEGGMNACSLGICLVGNYDHIRPPDQALALLATLVKSLQSTWSIPLTNIHRHSDFASYKSCPGRLFPWAEFIASLGCGINANQFSNHENRKG
jgi:N-acetyl-anhydromuramyl-L-alanine amidase AmpD